MNVSFVDVKQVERLPKPRLQVVSQTQRCHLNDLQEITPVCETCFDPTCCPLTACLNVNARVCVSFGGDGRGFT